MQTNELFKSKYIFYIIFIFFKRSILLQVLVSNSRANDVSASKQTAASTEAINNKKFMPSYKVLFRRSGRKKIISFIFTNFSLLKYLYMY